MPSKPYQTYRGNILQRLGLKKPTAELAGAEEHPVWMHPIEFSQIEAVLQTVAPTRMVEWGSGGSSRAWLQMLPDLELLWSVEHDAQWAQTVRDEIDDPRFHLVHEAPIGTEEPDHIPGNHETGMIHREWCLLLEQDPSIMAKYIDSPVDANVTFDVALVDGRARVHCMRTAFELVRPGGMVILHDAQREEYHATAHELGNPVFLEPWIQGQVCLIRVPN